MSTNQEQPTEKRRSWIFILIIFLLICGCVAVVAGPGRSLVLGFLSGGDNATETPTTPPLVCGDGQCNPDDKEDCTTCSQDCGVCQPACGDGQCDPNAKEDCTTCSQDCGVCEPACGDGKCDPNAKEDCATCSQDCGVCQTCGDGVCNKDAGEDCKSCEKDCGACPVVTTRGACLDPCDPSNSACQAGLACVPQATNSSQYVCWSQAICAPTSVPTCNNNGVCDPGEVSSCPDCKPCVCGDGVCEQARCNELVQNCPADCGGNPQPTCACVCTRVCGVAACWTVCADTCTGATCRP